MYTLEEVLELHGGLLRHGQLTESVSKTLEYYKQLSGVNPIFVANKSPKLETSGPSRFAGFYFAESWNCNAAVALSSNRPVFICNAGFPFIIYDFISRILSYPHILRDLIPEENTLDTGKNKFSERFDYRRFVSGDLADISDDRKKEIVKLMFSGSNNHKSDKPLAPLITELSDGWRKHLPHRPKNPQRRGLVTFMTHIINAFLFGHEACHINKGHLEYLRRQHGICDLIEFNVAQSNRHGSINNIFYQAMEYEADLAGLRKTLPYIFDDLALDRFWEFGFVRELGIQERARIWTFSLSAFFCLLEWERIKAKSFFSWLSNKNLKHPSGFLRLTNIMQHTVEAVSFEDGTGFDLEKFLKLSAADLAQITECLGISDEFLKTKSSHIAPQVGSDIMDSMRGELDGCAEDISNMYYIGGKNAGDVNIEEEAEDPYHLKGQSAGVYHREHGITEKRNFTTGFAEFYDKDGNLLRKIKMK